MLTYFEVSKKTILEMKISTFLRIRNLLHGANNVIFLNWPIGIFRKQNMVILVIHCLLRRVKLSCKILRRNEKCDDGNNNEGKNQSKLIKSGYESDTINYGNVERKVWINDYWEEKKN